jgi:hypothetical protein
LHASREAVLKFHEYLRSLWLPGAKHIPIAKGWYSDRIEGRVIDSLGGTIPIEPDFDAFKKRSQKWAYSKCRNFLGGSNRDRVAA